MKLPIYQVDAFTSRMFAGNPAAVVLLEEWLPDPVLAAIAAENNLAETAFVIPRGDVMPLRWFTPAVEVRSLRHATLATPVLFRYLSPMRLASRSAPRRGDAVNATVRSCSSLPARQQPVESRQVGFRAWARETPSSTCADLWRSSSGGAVRDFSGPRRAFRRSTFPILSRAGDGSDSLPLFATRRASGDPVTGSAKGTLVH